MEVVEMLQSDYKRKQVTTKSDLRHITTLVGMRNVALSDAEGARRSGFPEARGISRGLVFTPGGRRDVRPSKERSNRVEAVTFTEIPFVI